MPTVADEILAGIIAQEPESNRPANDALLREMKERTPPIDEAALRAGVAAALADGDDFLARNLAARLPPITGDVAITEPADGISQP